MEMTIFNYQLILNSSRVCINADDGVYSNNQYNMDIMNMSSEYTMIPCKLNARILNIDDRLPVKYLEETDKI